MRRKRSTVILVAEDETVIREGLVDVLSVEGYEVIEAVDGEEAVNLFQDKQNIDLLLLDIMMPKCSGYDVCRAVRERDGRVPILMLSAKSEEIDKVVGLELGADDYITKPFGIRELTARIAAALRRNNLEVDSAEESPGVFPFGDAIVDVRKYEVRRGGRMHSLTAREMDLLRLFYAKPDEVLTRDYLLDAGWGVQYMGTTRTLDQHVAQLRKKVEPNPDNPKTIITIHGVGYKYVAG